MKSKKTPGLNKINSVGIKYCSTLLHLQILDFLKLHVDGKQNS